MNLWLRGTFALCALLLSALSCLGDGGYLSLDGQCTSTEECQKVHPLMVCKGRFCECDESQGYKLCDPKSPLTRCIYLQNDSAHCGACNKACKTGEACCNGVCVDVSQGDSSQSPHRACGACERSCTQERPSCCNGSCIDTQTQPQHCGACNKACKQGESCCQGQCVSLLAGNNQKPAQFCGACKTSCSAEKPDCCSGSCVALATDNRHCGACNRACPQGQSCCQGQCVDLSQSKAHCGACNKACTDAQLCCNGSCVDANSPTSCGSCQRVCDAGERCCDQRCVNVQNDAQHCSQCGSSCYAQGRFFRKEQTQDGETLEFRIQGFPLPTAAQPLRLKVSVYGDYDADDEFATVFLCAGAQGTCDAKHPSLLKQVQILGGNPKCNATLTADHFHVFVLSSAEVSTADLTVRVVLSKQVSAKTCATSQPRVTVALGEKECCGGSCTDVLSSAAPNPPNCGACGRTCKDDERCCQGKCTDYDTDEDNCGSCGKACNPLTQWKRQVRSGESLPFFFTAAQLKNVNRPIPVRVALYGDYLGKQKSAKVHICRGITPECDDKHGLHLLTGTIDGGQPACNTSITDAHNAIFNIANTQLPAGEPLTVRVVLSKQVLYEICAQRSPRVVVSLGFERCCNGTCADLRGGIQNAKGQITHCGTCGTTCEAGEACCNGRCIDVQANDENCGACGKQCKPFSLFPIELLPKEIRQTSAGQNLTFSFNKVPKPTAQAPLIAKVELFGDFDSSAEYATVQFFVGGRAIQVKDDQGNAVTQARINGSKNQCNSSAGDPGATRRFKIEASQFSGGTLQVQVKLTGSVNPICKDSKVRVSFGQELCCQGACVVTQACGL